MRDVRFAFSMAGYGVVSILVVLALHFYGNGAYGTAFFVAILGNIVAVLTPPPRD